MSGEQLVVLGVIMGTVAAVAAVYAGFEARWARRSARGSEQAADHRWRVQTRPRPKVGFADPAQMMSITPGDSVQVLASNPGGAITSGLVIARVRDKLFIGGLSLPAQSGNTVSTLARLPEECPAKYWTGNMLSEILVVLAEDIEGTMWECRTGVETSKPMPSPGSEEFFGWLEKLRSQARNGKSATGRLVRTRLRAAELAARLLRVARFKAPG